jgi:hypothetical protein
LVRAMIQTVSIAPKAAGDHLLHPWGNRQRPILPEQSPAIANQVFAAEVVPASERLLPCGCPSLRGFPAGFTDKCMSRPSGLLSVRSGPQ